LWTLSSCVSPSPRWHSGSSSSHRPLRSRYATAYWSQVALHRSDCTVDLECLNFKLKPIVPVTARGVPLWSRCGATILTDMWKHCRAGYPHQVPSLGDEPQAGPGAARGSAPSPGPGPTLGLGHARGGASPSRSGTPTTVRSPLRVAFIGDRDGFDGMKASVLDRVSNMPRDLVSSVFVDFTGRDTGCGPAPRLSPTGNGPR
jgi:hypothetical protein